MILNSNPDHHQHNNDYSNNKIGKLFPKKSIKVGYVELMKNNYIMDIEELRE